MAELVRRWDGLSRLIRGGIIACLGAATFPVIHSLLSDSEAQNANPERSSIVGTPFAVGVGCRDQAAEVLARQAGNLVTFTCEKPDGSLSVVDHLAQVVLYHDSGQPTYNKIIDFHGDGDEVLLDFKDGKGMATV